MPDLNLTIFFPPKKNSYEDYVDIYTAKSKQDLQLIKASNSYILHRFLTKHMPKHNISKICTPHHLTCSTITKTPYFLISEPIPRPIDFIETVYERNKWTTCIL